jgi:hypothetical protein
MQPTLAPTSLSPGLPPCLLPTLNYSSPNPPRRFLAIARAAGVLSSGSEALTLHQFLLAHAQVGARGFEGRGVERPAPLPRPRPAAQCVHPLFPPPSHPPPPPSIHPCRRARSRRASTPRPPPPALSASPRRACSSRGRCCLTLTRRPGRSTSRFQAPSTFRSSVSRGAGLTWALTGADRRCGGACWGRVQVGPQRSR